MISQRKRIFRKVGIVIFLFCVSIFLFAEDIPVKQYNLKDIVSADSYDKLLKEGVVNHTLTNKDRSLSLIPDTPLARQFVHTQLENVSFEDYFVMESLHLVKKSELQKNSKSGSQNVDVSKDSVSRILRSVSKMKGMIYYSHSDKKWEVLYTEAYTIKNADDKTVVPDKNEGKIDGQTIYCYLKDHSFSGCRYELKYSRNENEIGMSLKNLDTIKKYLLTIVTPENMNNFFFVIDCGNSYLFYSTIQAKGPKISFLEKKLNDSLGSRIDAVYNWFIYQF